MTMHPGVQPEPGPQSWQVDIVTTDTGKTLVQLAFQCRDGTWHCFFGPTAAKNLAAQLEHNATRAETGLILPDGLER